MKQQVSAKSIVRDLDADGIEDFYRDELPKIEDPRERFEVWKECNKNYRELTNNELSTIQL